MNNIHSCKYCNKLWNPDKNNQCITCGAPFCKQDTCFGYYKGKPVTNPKEWMGLILECEDNRYFSEVI